MLLYNSYASLLPTLIFYLYQKTNPTSNDEFYSTPIIFL